MDTLTKDFETAKLELRTSATDYLKVVSKVQGAVVQLSSLKIQCRLLLMVFEKQLQRLQPLEARIEDLSIRLINEIRIQENEVDRCNVTISSANHSISAIQSNIRSNEDKKQKAKQQRIDEKERLRELKAENRELEEATEKAAATGAASAAVGTACLIGGLFFPPLAAASIPVYAAGAGIYAGGVAAVVILQKTKISQKNLDVLQENIDCYERRIDRLNGEKSALNAGLEQLQSKQRTNERNLQTARAQLADCRRFYRETTSWTPLLCAWIQMMQQLQDATLHVSHSWGNVLVQQKAIDYRQVVAQFEHENGPALEATRRLALQN